MDGRRLRCQRPTVRTATPTRRMPLLSWWPLLLVGLGCGGTAHGPAVPELGSIVHLEVIAAREVEAAHASLVASPRDVSRWVELGRALDRNDLRGRSIAVWRGATALAPKSAEYPYRAACAAVAVADERAAREALRIALERDAAYAPAWRALGALELDLGDSAAARAAFAQVVSLRPQWHDGHTGLALVALADGRSSDALRHAAQGLRSTPPQAYLRYLYGVALRAAGRLDEAVPHLAAGAGTPVVWNENGADASPSQLVDTELVQRADALAGEGKLPEAIAVYREAVARRPSDGRTRARLGVVLAASGETEAGVAELDAALAESPDNYYLLLGKADVLTLVGRVDEARATLQRASEVWPLRSEVLVQLGRLELGQARIAEAERAFQRAYWLEPALPTTSANLAHALILQRDFGGAALVLEEAAPKLAGAPPLDYYALLLSAQRNAGRSAEALSATRAAARRYHGDAARTLEE